VQAISNITRGLSSIAKEILEDAEKEAENLLRRAELQAEKILEKAEKKAEKRYKAILKEGKDKIKIEEQQAFTLFEIEVKNKMLQAKEKLVEEAFEKVLKRLREYVLTEDYRKCLLGLIAEASRRINLEKLMIEFNERDRRRITEKDLLELSRKIGVEFVKSEKTVDCIGGVIVKSPDGKITVDNTFENRLKTLKESLRAKIAKILFEEEGS